MDKQDSVDAIKLLHLSEDISRIMPGKKDHCSNIDNERKNTFTKAPFTYQFKRCLLVFFFFLNEEKMSCETLFYLYFV